MGYGGGDGLRGEEVVFSIEEGEREREKRERGKEGKRKVPSQKERARDQSRIQRAREETIILNTYARSWRVYLAEWF